MSIAVPVTITGKGSMAIVNGTARVAHGDTINHDDRDFINPISCSYTSVNKNV